MPVTEQQCNTAICKSHMHISSIGHTRQARPASEPSRSAFYRLIDKLTAAVAAPAAKCILCRRSANQCNHSFCVYTTCFIKKEPEPDTSLIATSFFIHFRAVSRQFTVTVLQQSVERSRIKTRIVVVVVVVVVYLFQQANKRYNKNIVSPTKSGNQKGKWPSCWPPIAQTE